MDARKFWTACRIHDWHYEMSDDPDVYRNGADARRNLQSLAMRDENLRPIYDAWYEYHFNAGAAPAEPKLED